MSRAWGALLVTCAACGGDAFGTGPIQPDTGPDGVAPDVIAIVVPEDAAVDSASGPDIASPDGAPDVLLGFHPDADAGEAAVDAAALETGPVEAACAPVVHDNGLGDHWTDCVPLGTYTLDEAMAACEASTREAGACLYGSQGSCGGLSGERWVYTYDSSYSIAHSWVYHGSEAGRVASGAPTSASGFPADCFTSSVPWR